MEDGDAGLDIQRAIHCLFDEQLYTDIEFVFENGKTLRAHKLVLSLFSSVLANTFNSDGGSEVNTLPHYNHLSYEGCQGMLRYIYAGQLPQVFEVIQICKASRLFSIKCLEDLCVTRAYRFCNDFNLNPNFMQYIFDFLDLAVYFGFKTVREQCLEIIRRRTKEVLCSVGDYLVDVQDDTMLELLTQSKLEAGSEVLLLQKTISRILKNKDHVQDARALLLSIDAASLTTAEWMDTWRQYPNFFEDSEIGSILANLFQPGSREWPEWCKSMIIVTKINNDDDAIPTRTRMERKICVRRYLKNPQSLVEVKRDPEVDFQLSLSSHFPGNFTYLVMLQLSRPLDCLIKTGLTVFDSESTGSFANEVYHSYQVCTEIDNTNRHFLVLCRPLKVEKDRKPIRVTLKLSINPSADHCLKICGMENLNEEQFLRSSYVEPVIVSVKSKRGGLPFYAPLNGDPEFVIKSLHFDDSCSERVIYNDRVLDNERFTEAFRGRVNNSARD